MRARSTPTPQPPVAGTPATPAPYTLLTGDCRQTLRALPDASVDAVVCDPPYGLSREPDVAEVLTHWLAGATYSHGASGFMGKTWDSFVPGPDYWREVYRVLKPGGHLVAFGGTRTYDLLCIALRLAGFELRDQLDWLYGSGFPKSLNVSKAIDKAAGAQRAIVGRNPLAAKQTGQRHTLAHGDRAPNLHLTAPATPEPLAWQGWGTALKPAHEPIALCRKPLSEDTVAANVLAYGTGALNVDGCRVATEEVTAPAPSLVRGTAAPFGQGIAMGGRGHDAGRWPANLLLSHSAACEAEAGECAPDCPVAALDAQSGNKSGAHGGNGRFRQHKWMLRETEQHIEHDTGGASRFFTQLDWDDALAAATPFYYTAKASRAERNAGLDSLPQLPYQATGWSGDSMPARQDTRPGRTAQQRPQPCAANTHPTVKPVAVMAWLCRLVCPPGGVVLDPFAGSGSTGVAALGEGMRFIGCEYEPEYAAIAQARLAHAHTTPQPAAKPKPAPKAVKRATAPTPAPAPTPTPRPAKKPKVATPGASAPAGQLLLFPAAAASASA